MQQFTAGCQPALWAAYFRKKNQQQLPAHGLPLLQDEPSWWRCSSWAFVCSMDRKWSQHRRTNNVNEPFAVAAIERLCVLRGLILFWTWSCLQDEGTFLETVSRQGGERDVSELPSSLYGHNSSEAAISQPFIWIPNSLFSYMSGSQLCSHCCCSRGE